MGNCPVVTEDDVQLIDVVRVAGDAVPMPAPVTLSTLTLPKASYVSASVTAYELPALDCVTCQRASNIDQRSASKIDQGGFGFLCY